MREMAQSRRVLNAPNFDASSVDASPDPARPTRPRPVKCDRSADIGSNHYWREGAQHGDLCLCGKRAKVVLEQCHSCHALFPMHRLFEVDIQTAKQTHSSPAEFDTVHVCRDCFHHVGQVDEAYERANAVWRETHGGEL
jgi:hypothetical protein